MSQSLLYLSDLATTMKLSTCHSLSVLIISLAISTSVLAQYVWLDENGRKQFSDHTPPPSVPNNKILKFAGKGMDNQSSTSSTTNSDNKSRQTESLAEKDLAFKKRRDELVEKEKKNETEARNVAVKSENCRRMKEYKQSLETNQRMMQMDAKGTRSFMTDEKRTQELNELHQNMSSCN